MGELVKSLKELWGPYFDGAMLYGDVTAWNLRDVEGNVKTLTKDFKVTKCDLCCEKELKPNSPFDVEVKDLVIHPLQEKDAHDPNIDKLWLRLVIHDTDADYYIFCDGPHFYFFGNSDRIPFVIADNLKKRLIIDIQLLGRLREATSDAWEL